jgi:hypothetical protein
MHQHHQGIIISDGAWACFRIPFPVNTYDGTTEGVGGLYGGGSAARSTASSLFEPSTLDIQNSHLSHDGKRGFNQGGSSEDLGQISAIAFWTKLTKGYSGVDLDANHQMRCFHDRHMLTMLCTLTMR